MFNQRKLMFKQKYCLWTRFLTKCSEFDVDDGGGYGVSDYSDEAVKTMRMTMRMMMMMMMIPEAAAWSPGSECLAARWSCSTEHIGMRRRNKRRDEEIIRLRPIRRLPSRELGCVIKLMKPKWSSTPPVQTIAEIIFPSPPWLIAFLKNPAYGRHWISWPIVAPIP